MNFAVSISVAVAFVVLNELSSCVVISPPAYVSSGADYCFDDVSFFSSFFSHLELYLIVFFTHQKADNRHCATIRYLWTTALKHEGMVFLPCMVGAQAP